MPWYNPFAKNSTIFGLKFRKPEKLEVEQQRIARETFVPPAIDDGAVVVESGSVFGHYIDIDSSNILNQDEVSIIRRYRDMAQHPDIELAIDDIVNEAIVYDGRSFPITINLDNLLISSETKTKIEEQLNYVLSLLDFSTKAYETFRRWYIDGRLFYHVIIDKDDPQAGIQEIRPIDSTKIQKIREFVKETNSAGIEIIVDEKEYFVYNGIGMADHQQYNSTLSIDTGIAINKDSILHVTSGLIDSMTGRVRSYLHKAVKPLNQLKMMEDSLVIYRVSRAPERRVFYIDVGNLPKIKAEQYIREIMNRYRNKLVYDTSTGELRDSHNHMAAIEDFWLPRKEGGKGTEISTLPGGQNLGELQDVDYFQKKLFRALNVPYTRILSDSNFNIGRSSEISREELRFSKFIERLRIRFSDLFYEALRIQLLLKGVVRPEEWEEVKSKISFDFRRDSYFKELKEFEVLKEKINIVRDMSDLAGRYYSDKWIKLNVLGQTEQDIEQMDTEIMAEKNKGNGEENPSGEGGPGGAGPGLEDFGAGGSPEEGPAPETPPIEEPELPGPEESPEKQEQYDRLITNINNTVLSENEFDEYDIEY